MFAHDIELSERQLVDLVARSRTHPIDRMRQHLREFHSNRIASALEELLESAYTNPTLVEKAFKIKVYDSPLCAPKVK